MDNLAIAYKVGVLLDKPRVYADLNKWEEVNGEFRVILTTLGTRKDLQRLGLTLEKGLVLDFQMDDEDADGSPDPLYFQGTVHFDEDAQHWVAVVVREDIRSASELHASELSQLNQAKEAYAYSNAV